MNTLIMSVALAIVCFAIVEYKVRKFKKKLDV
jgi:hypothetical protein